MPADIRVLNVNLDKKWGGTEQACLDYALALRQSGCEVSSVLLANSQGYFRQKMRGVRCHQVGRYLRLKILIQQEFKYIIKRDKPELVILHGGKALRFLQPIAKKLKIPTLSVTHLNKTYPVDSDYIIATTKPLLQAQLDRGRAKKEVFLLPNMIELPLHSPASRYIRRKVPVIGAIGRLIKSKGFDILLQALAKLKQQEIDFKLILAGDGPEMGSLKNLATKLGLADNIDFTGWCDNKAEFFNQIDVFILPSRYEPFGLVLLEAMAYQKPIIASKAQGPSEILSHMQDAILYDIEDAALLANHLTELLADKDMQLSLGRAANAKVESKYAMAKLAPKLKSICAQVRKL